MTLKIGGIVLDAEDPQKLAEFWSAATGFAIGFTSEAFAQLETDDSIGHFFFIKVPEGKSAKNRCHIDYEIAADSKAEIERLQEIGAVHVADHRMDDGFEWTVMQDPEGNEFCVSQSHS